jgi:uncharacterized protein YigA (DUF484 family)
MANEEPQTEVSWEDAVTRFLEDNPDFFTDRPELLAQLELTHPERGTAVSLIERQVGVLREQNQTLQRQLRELISNARENDVIGRRLHEFACALLQAGGVAELIDVSRSQIREKFRLDAVALRLGVASVPETAPQEVVAEDDDDIRQLLESARGKAPVCGVALPEVLQARLFGETAEGIRSVVIVPLAGDHFRGGLILGSQDPHRFEPGMATDYLVRLGELLRIALDHHF